MDKNKVLAGILIGVIGLSLLTHAEHEPHVEPRSPLENIMIPSSYMTISGTATSSSEMFNDGLQSVWNSGGKPSNCLMGAFQKRKVDSFTSNVKNVNAFGD